LGFCFALLGSFVYRGGNHANEARIAFGQHEDRTPTHGYEPTREAAMAAFS